MIDRERIINHYIEGYNAFNIDKMMVDLDDNIVFENIQNGEKNMTLSGREEFRRQAEQATSYFTTRTQTITSFTHASDTTEIEIEYSAILSMDFPNGLKKGQALNLTGRSLFQFSGNKILKITDIS